MNWVIFFRYDMPIMRKVIRFIEHDNNTRIQVLGGIWIDQDEVLMEFEDFITAKNVICQMYFELAKVEFDRRKRAAEHAKFLKRNDWDKRAEIDDLLDRFRRGQWIYEPVDTEAEEGPSQEG